MGALLVDTTVLIDLLRGRPEAVRRLEAARADGDIPHVCAISVEEIYRGLKPGEEEASGRLFAGLRTVDLGAQEGRRAGDWRRSRASRGVTLSQADCLVAAAALKLGGRLATGNPRDFPMPELSVEEWPPG